MLIWEQSLARRNLVKPDPVPLTVPGKTLATAYARRAPGTRAGKKHWSWEVQYVTPDGQRGTKSLGRVADELMPTEQIEEILGDLQGGVAK